MQCDIQYQGNKQTSSVDLEFVVTGNSPTKVIYNGKTGFLKKETREVFKDTNLIVLWFKIVKTKEPIPE
jgi:hypothetical protein